MADGELRHGNTKKTPERIAAILSALRAGNTRRASAHFAEINPETFYAWVNSDPTFANEVTKAEADAEVRFLEKIQSASETTWQASAWWLERRRAEDYKQQNGTHISGTLGLGDLIRATRKPSPQSTGDAQAQPTDNTEEPI
tara:strand:- start:4820 stop:5245 length:426 start_codon:yes stop_codon:yes gene_type:complete